MDKRSCFIRNRSPRVLQPCGRQRRLVMRQWVGAVLLTGAGRPALAVMDVCSRGQRQSPIDITATQARAMPALGFEYRSERPRIVNDGHTVRVRFAPGQRLRLGAQSLGLQQFHFHLPGGDRLKGEEFPMAMHFLHQAPDGRLVALVQWFRLGKAFAPLATLLPYLPQAGQPEKALTVALSPREWLAAEAGYFRYEGSLTGPPCTEGVLWLVLRQPLTLSAEQLALLGKYIAPNARAVQPLNGRVVTESS